LVQVIEGESEVTVAGKPIALRSGDIVLSAFYSTYNMSHYDILDG
jgi:uncharacterized cupin superfamily protein